MGTQVLPPSHETHTYSANNYVVSKCFFRTYFVYTMPLQLYFLVIPCNRRDTTVVNDLKFKQQTDNCKHQSWFMTSISVDMVIHEHKAYLFLNNPLALLNNTLFLISKAPLWSVIWECKSRLLNKQSGSLTAAPGVWCTKKKQGLGDTVS